MITDQPKESSTELVVNPESLEVKIDPTIEEEVKEKADKLKENVQKQNIGYSTTTDTYWCYDFSQCLSAIADYCRFTKIGSSSNQPETTGCCPDNCSEYHCTTCPHYECSCANCECSWPNISCKCPCFDCACPNIECSCPDCTDCCSDCPDCSDCNIIEVLCCPCMICSD